MRIKLLLFAAIILVLQSCTITKRYHTLGFHIEWNQHMKPNSKGVLSLKKADTKPEAALAVHKAKNMSDESLTPSEDSETDVLQSSLTTPRKGLQKNTILSHQILPISKGMVLQIDKNSSTSVQSIPEQLPKKKERKVGVVASFFLILGTFLIVYSIVGSMNVWAALGYFVFGFVAICIFLIIVAGKAINRRHRRSKQRK
jgi:hypothetical protein